MNYELFLAKRIIKDKKYKNSVSTPIIKIAILAIILGMVIMLISIGVTLGLQNKIREKLSGFNGHIQIVNFDANNSDITLVPISKNQNFFPEFENVEGINRIQPYATKPGVIRTETDFEGILAKGVDSTYNWDFYKDILVEGRLPDYSTKRLNQEVLISKKISERLGINLGDKFSTFFVKKNLNKPPNIRAYNVVGIYEANLEELDKNIIITDLRDIQRMNKWKPDQIGGFEVFIDDFDQIQQKNSEIYDQISSELNAISIVDKFANIIDWIVLIEKNTIVIICIMILIAGINMITALLVLILEKTNMIGVLKSLGANNTSIRKVFLYNATYLILIGLFWGNLIGLGVLFLQQKFNIITLDPKTYYVKSAPVFIEWYHVVFLNIGTLVLCFIMLLLPSYIITKVNPVKAIKFQ
ncbi:ABC transporter permease [Aureivirga sp. CE67]|uniref:ABC transporter permease n=1 Tax=Aureivirga sp. CE67 TaxID=1788983 RepID=UPI0018C9530D|nr:FtsX-like permease family protein [Aureivirga sp. CE67]